MSQYLDVAIGFVLFDFSRFSAGAKKGGKFGSHFYICYILLLDISCYLPVKSKVQNDIAKKRLVEGKL